VLCNEEPLVFHAPLYATAAWFGALAYLGLAALGVDVAIAALAAGGAIFLLRLIAIRWRLGLPRFASRESGDGRK
jgi:uncharacterized membrane protein YeiH